LPVGCWIIDGKVVRDERLGGVVRRLSGQELHAAFGLTLPRLTNVRLRVRFPWLDRESGDLYGKIVGEADRDGVTLTRIRLTSVTPADEASLATLIG
jgi:hypothetical protein